MKNVQKRHKKCESILMQETIKIKPKSLKGTNRVSEIKKAFPNWDGETWNIFTQSETVLFSPTIGGWLFIAPNVDLLGKKSKFARWFNQFSDVYFERC
jgi:hypothetical protein